MPGSARIDSAEHLVNLAEAIHLFEIAGRSTLLDVNSTLAEIMDQLRTRQAGCERAVMQCEEALAGCLANEDADCSWESAALGGAEDALADARQWVERGHDLTRTFYANVSRFEQLFDSHCANARSFLAGKGQALERYEGPSALPSRPAAASSAAPNLPFRGSTAPVGASTRIIGAGDVVGVPVTRVGNRQFAEIAIDRIETPAFKPGEWEQADLADMQRSFARLPEIMQALRLGMIEPLIAADSDARRVYDWFFGSGPIRLDGVRQGKFMISNGKHRIHLAKALGLGSVPAHLVGLH